MTGTNMKKWGREKMREKMGEKMGTVLEGTGLIH